MGGNKSNTIQLMDEAMLCLEQSLGYIFCKGSLYKTEAWGGVAQNDFLNIMLFLETYCGPFQCFNEIKEIEHLLNKDKLEFNGSRNIDIDLIFYDSLIINTKDLELPHPRFHLRKFSLLPLQEIMPLWVHPKTKKSINELLIQSKDNLKIEKLGPWK